MLTDEKVEDVLDVADEREGAHSELNVDLRIARRVPGDGNATIAARVEQVMGRHIEAPDDSVIVLPGDVLMPQLVVTPGRTYHAPEAGITAHDVGAITKANG